MQRDKTFFVYVLLFNSFKNVRFFDSFSLSFRNAEITKKACRIVPIEAFPPPAKMSKMEYCAQSLQSFYRKSFIKHILVLEFFIRVC